MISYYKINILFAIVNKINQNFFDASSIYSSATSSPIYLAIILIFTILKSFPPFTLTTPSKPSTPTRIPNCPLKSPAIILIFSFFCGGTGAKNCCSIKQCSCESSKLTIQEVGDSRQLITPVRLSYCPLLKEAPVVLSGIMRTCMSIVNHSLGFELTIV